MTHFARDALDDFHPSTVIRDWGNNDAYLLESALTGVAIFGGTGSGKTSGPGKHIALGYLAADFGGLVLCSKVEERAQWVQWAKEVGREQDLVIIDKSAKWRYNFLQHEATRSGGGAGLTINLVAVLKEIANAVKGVDAKASGGDSKFFDDALELMLTNLVDLVLFSGLPISLPLMRDVVLSAAQTLDEANSADWHANSICAAVLSEAAERAEMLDEAAQADYAECRAYWMVQFPGTSMKTRSIFTLMFSMMTRPLTTRPLRRLFSSDTNFTPEVTFDGRIIIVDLPVQEFKLVGRLANILMKYCFQCSVLRRPKPTSGHLRPVFLFADEAQMFISLFDAEYQAVARSAGGCTVYMTQNRESYRRVLGNNDAVDSLLGNLQCKIFCQNSSIDTNDYAAKTIGEHYQNVVGTNIGRGAEGAANSGVNQSEQRRYFVEPATFAALRHGGQTNAYQVDSIVYDGGRLFSAIADGREQLFPYRLLRFNQRE